MHSKHVRGANLVYEVLGNGGPWVEFEKQCRSHDRDKADRSILQVIPEHSVRISLEENGAPEEIRTPNLLIRS